MVILGQAGRVQRDGVGLRKQRVQVNVRGVRADVVVGVRVVRKNLATKAAQVAHHRGANAPGADDAHRGGGDVLAQLAVQAKVLRRGVARQQLDLALRHEHQHDGVVGHALWRVRRVRHAHAQLARVGHVDVLVADGARGEVAHALRPERVEQLRRHGVGDYAQRVMPRGKVGVIQRGIVAGPIELEAHLACSCLHILEFVVFAQRIGKKPHEKNLPR